MNPLGPLKISVIERATLAVVCLLRLGMRMRKFRTRQAGIRGGCIGGVALGVSHDGSTFNHFPSSLFDSSESSTDALPRYIYYHIISLTNVFSCVLCVVFRVRLLLFACVLRQGSPKLQAGAAGFNTRSKELAEGAEGVLRLRNSKKSRMLRGVWDSFNWKCKSSEDSKFHF